MLQVIRQKSRAISAAAAVIATSAGALWDSASVGEAPSDVLYLIAAAAVFGFGWASGRKRAMAEVAVALVALSAILELVARLLDYVPRDDYPVSPLVLVFAAPLAALLAGAGVYGRGAARR
jgi:hypothetical protein